MKKNGCPPGKKKIGNICIPQDSITLNEFRKKIKNMGYRVQTHIVDFTNMGYSAHRHLEVLDQDKNFVCGSGANVYTQETISKHKDAFDLLNEWRGKVYDKEGDKVLF